jgi:hypothetical protein
MIRFRRSTILVRSRCGFWISLCLVLFVVSSSRWITNAFATSWPIPQCVPITTFHPQLVDSRDLPSDLTSFARRNAEYYFAKVAPNRSEPSLHAYVVDVGPLSVFFPEKECPTGCAAFLVRTNERENFVKSIFFVSHMVTLFYPVPSQVFLAGDGIHFIEIRDHRKGYDVNQDVEVREWWKPPSSAAYMFSSRFTMCLLRGTFGLVPETSPSSNPDPQ